AQDLLPLRQPVERGSGGADSRDPRGPRNRPRPAESPRSARRPRVRSAAHRRATARMEATGGGPPPRQIPARLFLVVGLLPDRVPASARLVEPAQLRRRPVVAARGNAA